MHEVMNDDAFAAAFADAAYRESDEARRRGAELSGRPAEFIDVDDTQVLIAGGWIAFRGTDGIRDAMTDAGCAAPLASACFAAASAVGVPAWHAGFADAWRAVRAAVLARLDERERPCFVGHSLGGALALLATADWAEVLGRCDAADVITFGAPRAGNAAAMRLVERAARVRRWVHNSDVVPRIPPALTGYRHPRGEVRYVSSTGAVWRDPSTLAVLADRVRGRFAGGPLDGVRDHAMRHYSAAAGAPR